MTKICSRQLKSDGSVDVHAEFFVIVLARREESLPTNAQVLPSERDRTTQRRRAEASLLGTKPPQPGPARRRAPTCARTTARRGATRARARAPRTAKGIHASRPRAPHRMRRSHRRIPREDRCQR